METSNPKDTGTAEELTELKQWEPQLECYKSAKSRARKLAKPRQWSKTKAAFEFAKIFKADCVSKSPQASSFWLDDVRQRLADAKAASCNGCSQYQMNARRLYQELAKEGVPNTAIHYARACYEGLGGQKKTEKARVWFAVAYEEGYLESAFYLAEMCEDENSQDARELYKIAADSGKHCMANYQFARMCHEGLGGDIHLGNAVKYYRRYYNMPDAAEFYRVPAEEELKRLLSIKICNERTRHDS